MCAWSGWGGFARITRSLDFPFLSSLNSHFRLLRDVIQMDFAFKHQYSENSIMPLGRGREESTECAGRVFQIICYCMQQAHECISCSPTGVERWSGGRWGWAEVVETDPSFVTETPPFL